MNNRLITLSAVAVSAVSGCSDGPATAPGHSSHDAQPRNSAAVVALNNRDLAVIRQATAAYLQINAASADGFQQMSPCVSSQLGRGGMGFHYGIPARMFDDVIDPANPELLNYEPQGRVHATWSSRVFRRTGRVGRDALRATVYRRKRV